MVIPANETQGSFPLVIKHDSMDEEDQTVKVSLAANADGSATEHTNTAEFPSSYTYTIEDNDDPPYVSYSALAPTVSEDDESYTIRVNIDDSNADGFVDISEKEIQLYVNPLTSTTATASDDPITGGDGSSYWDYTIFSDALISIAAGGEYGEVVVTIKNDDIPEPDQAIDIQLTIANGNAQLELDDDGDPEADEMVLTIQDTDADPFVNFTSSDGTAFIGSVTQTESADHTAYFYLTKLSENDITVGYSVSGTGTYQATNASGATGAPSLSLIHISEPTRRYAISYAVICL